MKRLFTLLALALPLVLASCDGDNDYYEARVLSGQWTGDMGMYYSETNPYTGQTVYFDADYTDIVFYPDYDYATHGYGKQVDYYTYSPVKRMYFYFDWEVINGRIYISYPYDPELSAVISNYSLNDRRFKGLIGINNTPFTLYKIAGYYDWEYYNDYGYYYDYLDPSWNWSYYNDYYPSYPYGPYGPYYSKTRSGADGDSTSVAAPEKPINRKVGNRYMDGTYNK